MSRMKKKKIISVICYVLIFASLLIPMIALNNRKYSFLMVAIQAAIDNRGYDVRVIIQSTLLILYCVISILYLLSCIADRCFRINLLNVFGIIIFTGIHLDEPSMLTLCENDPKGKLLVFFIVFVTVFEFIIRFLPEMKAVETKAKEFKENSVINQSKLFYHIIWKNFKQNWKDYLLILVCNIVLFTVTVVAFHMMQLLDGEYGLRKIQFFNGLSEILMNAMIPMGLLSMFLIIILVFYYLKMRAKNYGILLTLGMYRRTLYFVTVLEFGFVFISSLFGGGILGRGFSGLLVNEINRKFAFALSLESIGIKPYLYSLAAISVIYLVSFMAAKDIFYDFNVGKSEDMRGIAEVIPGKIRYLSMIFGSILCLYSIFQYRKLYQFENEYLLLVFFIGLFFLIRNGMVEYLIRERKDTGYIKKLLIHNQLYHKSKTNAGFITIFTIIQFCILFYFSFQFTSVLIAEEPDEIFPYDFVCLADKSDDEFFKELSEEYDIELYAYPMVRVSSYDATEKLENPKAGEKTIQGKHIGVSESTYHSLKKLLDSDYVENDLKLDAEGEKIYVVYQQDKSVKAQPLSFYIPRKKALLHIGDPCESFDVFDLNRKEIGFKNYKVIGREIGSLVGSFRQGLRENIIVFSDEYFEQAKDFWKTVNIRTGQIIKEEEMRIPGLTIAQGVTKLVVMKVNEKDLSLVSNELNKLEKKHLNIENEIYHTMTLYGDWASGIYDSTVSYVYAKHETIESIEIERVMKMIMSIASIGLFICMNFMVLIVKMLSEQGLNVRRQEFLKCMGMPFKERTELIKKEYFKYYCMIPVILASLSTLIYTKLVFDARMYTHTDIKNYLLQYMPMAIIYMVVYSIITYFIIKIYAKRLEGNI